MFRLAGGGPLRVVRPLVRVDDNGAGPLVHQRHLHIRAELAVLHVPEALPVHLGKEQLVGIHRKRGPGRFDKAGAVALFVSP